MCEFLHCNKFCCRRRRDVIADNFGFDSHGTINQRAVDVLHAKGTVDDRLLILYFKWRSSEIKLILNDAVQPDLMQFAIFTERIFQNRSSNIVA